MLVIPKPPVKVWHHGQPYEAVAYFDDAAVTVRSDGALFLFPVAHLETELKDRPESVKKLYGPEPSAPLVCGGHLLNDDERCVKCGVSKKAIQKAGESYLWASPQTKETRNTAATHESVKVPVPGWVQRVRQLSGEPGATVRVVVEDANGFPILSENLDAGKL